MLIAGASLLKCVNAESSTREHTTVRCAHVERGSEETHAGQNSSETPHLNGLNHLSRVGWLVGRLNSIFHPTTNALTRAQKNENISLGPSIL
jgi:hypothetical protein